MEEIEKSEKIVKPLSTIYADAKQALTQQINRTMGAYRLPLFMAEGILSSILADMRANVANELSEENEKYIADLQQGYEEKIKSLEVQHEKEMQQLIKEFESGAEEITTEVVYGNH